MTPQPARSVAGHRERARERAERLLVVRRDQQQVLLARAGGERVEAEVADAVEPVEGLRRHVVRHAVDPDRALGALGAVVQPVDEVPRHRAAVGQLAGAGRPPPGHARAGAGRRTRRPGRAGRPARPSAVPCTRAGPLARPDRARRARPTARPARRPGRARPARARARASRATGPWRRYVRSCRRSPSHTAHHAVRAGPDPRGRGAQHQRRARRPRPTSSSCASGMRGILAAPGVD